MDPAPQAKRRRQTASAAPPLQEEDESVDVAPPLGAPQPRDPAAVAAAADEAARAVVARERARVEDDMPLVSSRLPAIGRAKKHTEPTELDAAVELLSDVMEERRYASRASGCKSSRR